LSLLALRFGKRLRITRAEVLKPLEAYCDLALAGRTRLVAFGYTAQIGGPTDPRTD
jgi:hypothetical protein